ncbi:rhomboid family intramembrane serine protease [Algisphaera agarilytica]|uniref:Peptidase S54 rhomboid domain-containing protein n=1 Tax=Algisphaera agarilytica TaxID=1385975 RepID=A0A7X0H8N8_9BACT|nr:rhomboid family intramembrane serine protease [Algisphaera agarilytica]MBB6431330.1 hypothetical protein [Algisphaera agarilytica]
MKWTRQLEHKLAGFAVPHLTLGIIGVQIMSFLAGVSNPDIAAGMVLDTQLVRQGEWWRIFTFMMVPPSGFFLFAVIAWYILYFTGAGLENAIGTPKYNLYWLIGYLASVAVAFAVPGAPVSNAFLATSVFLAFAVLYPDFEILLFFILPVKMKWLGMFSGGIFVYIAISRIAVGAWAGPAMVFAATLNFMIFFGPELLRRIKRGHNQMKRQRDAIAEANEPFHRCSVCGITDISHPQAEFRYNAEANGTVCYCLDHLPGGDEK